MSKVTSTRFNENKRYDHSDVSIRDRIDREGVNILGLAAEVDDVVSILQENLPDIIVREKAMPGWLGYILVNAEFPGESKKILDQLRGAVMPTVKNHHKFKIFASHIVTQAEAELRSYPDKRDDIEKNLNSIIAFKTGEKIDIEHVKVSEITLQLFGEILKSEDTGLKIKRPFKGGGVYDGMTIMKEEGDYALTEIREGSYYVKHDYYSYSGELKGTYYNINTQVEFYPGKVRYVDLEVDVVKESGGKTQIIDMEMLEKYQKEGFINSSLAMQAKKIAEELMHQPS